MNVFAITDRVKTYQSALRKQVRQNIPISEQHDIAGIRVVVGTSHEAQVIARFAREEQWRDRVKTIKDETVDRTNGYRAHHIVFDVDWKSAHSHIKVFLELQIQTIFQHAYNFISRAWVYQSARPLSDEWRRRFKRVSAELRELEKEVSFLHESILQASGTLDDEPLTPLSYQRVVSEVFGETVTLDEAVETTVLLADAGYETNGDVRRLFKSSKIAAQRERLNHVKSGDARKFAESLANTPLHRFYVHFSGNWMDEFIDELEAGGA